MSVHFDLLRLLLLGCSLQRGSRNFVSAIGKMAVLCLSVEVTRDVLAERVIALNVRTIGGIVGAR